MGLRVVNNSLIENGGRAECFRKKELSGQLKIRLLQTHAWPQRVTHANLLQINL